MATTMPADRAGALRTMCEVNRKPAKAKLTECEPNHWQAVIGAAIDRARMVCGWNVNEFADAVHRDRAQVSRWIAGTERAQFDALFAVEALRGPLVVQLAGLSADIEVVTEIRVRRTA